MLFISKHGHVDAERVKVKIFSKIERGPLKTVNGIVVHQTDGSTAESTFSNYMKEGVNGAHFLIEKDGTIYQTASLFRRTNHVGLLKSRCLETHTCSPVELKKVSAMRHKYTELSRHEHRKKWPERYPSNYDSIGIELVGMAYKKAEAKSEDDDAKEYEKVTEKQNASLRWLVKELIATFDVSVHEVYRHPTLSYKNETEAGTAQW